MGYLTPCFLRAKRLSVSQWYYLSVLEEFRSNSTENHPSLLSDNAQFWPPRFFRATDRSYPTYVKQLARKGLLIFSVLLRLSGCQNYNSYIPH